MRQVFITSRLRLREFDDAGADDAAFIVQLLNDADFIRNIADKKVRTPQDALDYLQQGPLASYAKNGFGLWCVERLSDGVRMGMCGLIRRPGLADVDVGYAFLPAFRGQGYALEAAQGSMDYGLHQLGLPRVVAIVTPGNEASESLLRKLGLQCQGLIDLGQTTGHAPCQTHLYR